MKLLTFCQFSVNLLLVQQTNAATPAPAKWMIDSSCDISSGKEQLVRDAMHKALELAAAASRAIHAPTTAFQAAMNLMFEVGDPTFGLTWGQTVFDASNYGINRFNNANEVFLGSHLNASDVKIYCDQSRIQVTTVDGKKVNFDPDIKNNLAENDYSKCRIGTLMYTTKPLDYTASPEAQPHLQVQICPWYLAYALPLRNQGVWSMMGLKPSFWSKLSYKAWLAWEKTLHPQIDAFASFESTLLHELAHASRSYSTIDVKDSSGKEAYGLGWKRIRDIRSLRSITPGRVLNQEGPVNGPELNADTWMYTALIAWLLEQGKITGVTADGKVTTS